MSSIRIRLPLPMGSIRYLSTTRFMRQTSPGPIPYITSCPSPTCTCAETPADLDIDRKTPLLNTMAAYSEQVIVCTGKDDWTSRIEDEQTPSGEFVRGLKGIIGKGGPGFDPFNNVLITASSLPAPKTPNTTRTLLFPAFKYLSNIPHNTPTYSNLATAYLKSRSLHPAHASLSPEQKVQLLRDESLATSPTLPEPQPITTPTVLICGHGGRDKRCGILGPILRDAFKTEFSRRGIEGEVGLVSHIGGHKYAGNVIIYIPPASSGSDSASSNALAGSGIWYGRVDPSTVEGIVEETVVKGRVIMDLFRGGIRKDGANLGRLLEAQIRKDGGDDGALKLRPKARR